MSWEEARAEWHDPCFQSVQNPCAVQGWGLKTMKNKLLTVLAVGLLAGPMTANALLVQSSTSVFVTFRDCTTTAPTSDPIRQVPTQ